MNMLGNNEDKVRDYALSLKQVKAEIDYARRFKRELVSGVGHADTAAVFSNILGEEIPMNRINVTLVPGDRAIVRATQFALAARLRQARPP